MAITGRFDADFKSFFDACEKAVVQLKGFDAATGKVEGSLNRLVDNFSGRKIISEATLMAEAIERVGGYSKLTAAELERVGAVGAEAAEKLRAWGQEVPKNISDMANNAKDATKEFSGLESMVGNLVGTFAAMFTAQAALGFAKTILEDASALKKLSDETQISVEELQYLAGAMGESGVDAQQLGAALFTLSRKIAGGDDSVEKALAKMGLSLEDVAGMNGEQLFLTIEHGLAQLQGSMRDTTAAELFGSKLGAAMGGASTSIDTALEKAKRLNTVMSTESVEALAHFNDEIARAQTTLIAFAANMAGPVAEGFNRLTDAWQNGTSKLSTMWAMTKDFFAVGVGLGTGTENLTRLFDEQNKKLEENAAKTKVATVATNEHAAAQANAGANSKATTALIEAQKDQLALYAEIEKTTWQLAMDHQKQWREEVEKQTAAKNKTVVDGLTQIQNAERATADFIAKTSLDSANYQINKIWETADAEIAAFKGSEEQRAAYTEQVIELAWRKAQAIRDAEDQAATATEKSSQRQVASIKNVTLSYYEQIDAAARAAGAALTEAGGDFSISGNRAPYLDPVTGKWVDESKTGGGGALGGNFQYSGGGVTDPRVLAYTSAGYTLGEAQALVGGWGSMIGPANRRAGGGPVSGGSSYLVGERGPELFTPSASGLISPNGGASVVNHIYVNGTAADVARQVAAEILRTITAGGKLSSMNL